jgi:hypothetical protein
MNRQISILVVSAACLALFTGCGDDGGTDVQITPPTVTATSPQDGATGIGMVPLVTVSFSEEMEASTLAEIGVTGIVTHHVDYDTLGNKATVYISEPLAGETVYEVIVPASVKDAEGHSLGTDYTFSFTTGALDAANAADYFEPNDATNETTDIEVPCTYPVLSSCGGSERKDYFRFTLEEAAKVTFRLERADGGPAVRWSCSFVRRPYQIFANGDSLRSGEEVSDYYSFLPGTYLLQVGKQDEDEEIVFYSLTIETSTPCADDVHEDNDFSSEAAPIDPGYYTDLISCYRDIDNYTIDVTAGKMLIITGDNVSGRTVKGGVYIYDPDWNLVAKDEGTHNPLSAAWTATMDGTYMFSVGWPLDEVEYWLMVEVRQWAR